MTTAQYETVTRLHRRICLRVFAFNKKIKMAVDVEKAAKMYMAQSPKRRLLYSVGLFVFAAGGLYLSDKLDEMLPAPDRKDTILEWKRDHEKQLEKELE